MVWRRPLQWRSSGVFGSRDNEKLLSGEGLSRIEIDGERLTDGKLYGFLRLLLPAGAETTRSAGRFGVNGHEPAIDFAKVNDHVHSVIAAIAPLSNDSVTTPLSTRSAPRIG